MAKTEAKHTLEEGEEAVIELRGPKRQRTDERNAIQTASQPLVSEEQKFWTAIAEPPDVNYWKILEWDFESMKRLKPGNHGLHFTERALRFPALDAELEGLLLKTYLKWIDDNGKSLEVPDNGRKEEFLDGLHKALKEDQIAVDRDTEIAHQKYRVVSDERRKTRMNNPERLKEILEILRRAKIAADSAAEREGEKTPLQGLEEEHDVKSGIPSCEEIDGHPAPNNKPTCICS